jgi:hypothetical protein
MNHFDISDIEEEIKSIISKCALNTNQAALFRDIYINKIFQEQKCVTSDYYYYHEWILLQDLIYTRLNIYPNNIIEENIILHEEEQLYNKNEKDYSFMTLQYFNEPLFVFFKTLEIGKFAPYLSI